MKNLFYLFSLLILFQACTNSSSQKESEDMGEWIQLFNGKDLDDWKVKAQTLSVLSSVVNQQNFTELEGKDCKT